MKAAAVAEAGPGLPPALPHKPAPRQPFPWADVMALGLGLLRLSPDQFWAMTPREFERAASAVKGSRFAPMARGELEGLMRMFPD